MRVGPRFPELGRRVVRDSPVSSPCSRRRDGPGTGSHNDPSLHKHVHRRLDWRSPDREPSGRTGGPPDRPGGRKVDPERRTLGGRGGSRPSRSRDRKRSLHPHLGNQVKEGLVSLDRIDDTQSAREGGTLCPWRLRLVMEQTTVSEQTTVELVHFIPLKCVWGF